MKIFSRCRNLYRSPRVTERPRNALIIRATAYSALGRHLEAIADLDRAFKIDSGNARAHAARAIAYTNLGQDAQARENADRAVHLGVNRAAMDRALEEIKQRR